MHWNSSRGWIRCDHVVDEAAEAEPCMSRSSLSTCPSIRMIDNSTRNKVQCDQYALSASQIIDSDVWKSAPAGSSKASDLSCQLADYSNKNDNSQGPRASPINNRRFSSLQKQEEKPKSRSPIAISEIVSSKLWKERTVSQSTPTPVPGMASTNHENPALSCQPSHQEPAKDQAMEVGDLSRPILIHSDTPSQQRPAEPNKVGHATTERRKFQLVYDAIYESSQY